MKVLTSLLGALAASLFLLSPAWTQAPVPVAFLSVNVVPMDGPRVLANQNVVIEGDRIVAIGPTSRVVIPRNAVTIDGEGKYLVPGLAEMHGHNPPPGASEADVARTYFLYVANGVTFVRSMLGWDGQIELREKVRRDELVGPTLYLAGPSFNGQTVKTPAEAIQRVHDQKKQGWDVLKVHPGVPRDAYDAMARTAKEVGIPFGGHVPADVGLTHAIEMGQHTIDHLDGYVEQLGATKAPVDQARLRELVRFTRGYGAAVVPTMVLWDSVIGANDLAAMTRFEELKYIPASEVAAWTSGYKQRHSGPGFNAAAAKQTAANRRIILKALNDGGVDILFGTDSPQTFSVPGFSIHREMQAMSAAGLTPYEILASATRNVAAHLGQSGEFGVVAVGSRADLVLVNGNPLQDIGKLAQPAGVVVRGRWYPGTDIAKRLDTIAASLRK